MKLRPQGYKLNGSGAITATIAVLDNNDSLVFEEVVHLSEKKKRNRFINEVADRFKLPRERVEPVVLRMMESQREEFIASTASVQTERKPLSIVKAFLESGAYLFHDQYEEPYVAMDEGESRAIYTMDSRAFKNKIAYQAYSKFQEVLSSETLRAALGVLQGKARFDGPMHRLHVRTAWHEGAIYYDLGDWRAVHVTPDGWTVDSRPPILFRHFPQQLRQVEPKHGGKLSDILSLLNLTHEHQKLLYVTDLVAGNVPGIPRAISIVHGPHGSAKSWLLRLKRRLQDPAEIEVQAARRN